MMHFTANKQAYIEQYRRLASLLAQPYDPDAGEEALAALCNRDTLQGRELSALDADVAESIARASVEWAQRLPRWATDCGFARHAWWLKLRRMAAECVEGGARLAG
jgi:hypothetical protein